MQQLAEFKTLYPEFNLPSFQDVLSGIQKDTIMRVATYLIGNDLYSGKDLDNRIVIENWFSAGNKVFGQNAYDRIQNYFEEHSKILKIVSVISCLKILQLGLELEEKAMLNAKSKEQSEIDLFFAMLVSNQNEDYNQTEDIVYVKLLCKILNYAIDNKTKIQKALHNIFVYITEVMQSFA